jgi:ribosomal 50S subunit-recycling heat shock protein
MIHYPIISARKKDVKLFCTRFFIFYKKVVQKGVFYMRIDKFLKVSRILKRRTVAQEACSEEKVMINGKAAKPSTAVKIGDVVEVLYSSGVLKFRILNIKETVKKEEASSLYEVIV